MQVNLRQIGWRLGGVMLVVVNVASLKQRSGGLQRSGNLTSTLWSHKRLYTTSFHACNSIPQHLETDFYVLNQFPFSKLNSKHLKCLPIESLMFHIRYDTMEQSRLNCVFLVKVIQTLSIRRSYFHHPLLSLFRLSCPFY